MLKANPRRGRPLIMSEVTQGERDPEFAGEEVEEAFHPRPSLMERGCMVICEIGIV